jgi:phospholipase/carboxylesterase
MMRGFSLVHAVREPHARHQGPAPVLLMLHGVGSNEQDLMGLAPLLDPRLFIVSARAPITLQHGSYGWYHVEFTPHGHVINPEEAEASRIRILSFVDELLDSYNVDPDRVYLMGFSQGCIMSLASALTRPRRFAGVIGMSGRLLPDILTKAAPESQLRGLPALIVHGTNDTVLSIEYGRAIRDALEKLPVDLTYREYPIGHNISNESLSDIQHWLDERLNSTEDWRITSEL